MKEGGEQEELLWRAREELSKRHHQPNLSESHTLYPKTKKKKNQRKDKLLTEARSSLRHFYKHVVCSYDQM